MSRYEYEATGINTRVFSNDDGETLPELLKRIRKWTKQSEAESLWLNFLDLRIDNDGEGNLTAVVTYVNELA